MGANELHETAQAIVADGKGHPRRRRERRHDQEALRLDRGRVDRGEPPRLPGAALHDRGRRGVHQRGHPLRRDDPPERLGRDAVPEAARVEGRSFPGSRSTRAPSRWRWPRARRSPRASTDCASGCRSTASSAPASRSGARSTRSGEPDPERVPHLDERARARPLRRALQEARLVPIVEPEVLMDGDALHRAELQG